MGIRAWYITWLGAAIVLIITFTVAISVVPETNPRQLVTRPFDVRRTVAPLRGSLTERALRPVPLIHDALWPPLPAFV